MGKYINRLWPSVSEQLPISSFLLTFCRLPKLKFSACWYFSLQDNMRCIWLLALAGAVSCLPKTGTNTTGVTKTTRSPQPRPPTQTTTHTTDHTGSGTSGVDTTSGTSNATGTGSGGSNTTSGTSNATGTVSGGSQTSSGASKTTGTGAGGSNTSSGTFVQTQTTRPTSSGSGVIFIAPVTSSVAAPKTTQGGTVIPCNLWFFNTCLRWDDFDIFGWNINIAPGVYPP